METNKNDISEEYKYGFSDPEKYVFKSKKGLSEDIVNEISGIKNEPEWMRKYRLNALSIFLKKPLPTWGADLSHIDFDNLYYYIKPSERNSNDWNDVPEDIKNTFEKLGIPEAERKFLAGVGAQYESEVVYHSLKKELENLGVIFTDTDSALKNYPEIFKKYFSSIVPPADNKFAALNSAVWSGGSFIYIPEGVKVDIPLQAYFRINAERMGQFERTLIIAEPGSYLHYIEGCTAPIYSNDSLHSAVVEIIVKKGARVRYTTIQNWSNNVYNLVTKRAAAYEDSVVEWIDGNLGSKVTMKYPSVYLYGKGSRADVLSIAFAGKGQHQDTGTKVIHLSPSTSSVITSKSISKNGGRTSYRGLLKVCKDAKEVKSNVRCDALILDDISRSDTYPIMEVEEKKVSIGHEATVSKIEDTQLFYLMSRGLTKDEATVMIINGFIEPFVKELPMEYAIEMNRLIQIQMDESIG